MDVDLITGGNLPDSTVTISWWQRRWDGHWFVADREAQRLLDFLRYGVVIELLGADQGAHEIIRSNQGSRLVLDRPYTSRHSTG